MKTTPFSPKLSQLTSPLSALFLLILAGAIFLLPTMTRAAIVDAATMVTSGTEHSCAVLTDGTVKCWGADWGEQLGDGTAGIANQFSPQPATGITSAAKVYAGNYHNCAVLSDSTVKCWGVNWGGQVGDGTYTNQPTPTTVSGLSGVDMIAAGSDHTCALLSSGSVKCWGSDQYGQLGNGGGGTSTTPVDVTGISNATSITAGEYHTCVVLTDNTAKCWGNNLAGQLGDGTTTDRNTPVVVSSLSNATAIDGGSMYTCAVLSDGTVKCWGDNTAGQLGDGTTTDSTTPVTVSSISNATGIAANTGYDPDPLPDPDPEYPDSHTCAFLSDNTVKCWGANWAGQLGDGSTTASTTPVTVSGLSDVDQLSTGIAFSCAHKTDSTVYCWGNNSTGYLGIGNTNDSLTPVKAIDLTVDDGGSSGGGGESLWSQIGNAIYYALGNVGIGTNNPQEKLDVDGNIRVSGNILPNGDLCIGSCS